MIPYTSAGGIYFLHMWYDDCAPIEMLRFKWESHISGIDGLEAKKWH